MMQQKIMQAWQIPSYGSAPELCHLPIPEAVSGHVVAEIHYAACNPIDEKIRTLGAGLPFAPEPPFTPLMDFSGIVCQAPEGSALREGDKICGMMGSINQEQGVLARYALIDEKRLVKLDEDANLADYAALGVAGCTALAACDYLAPERDEDILLYGAAGGVGHIALQIFSALGARVHAVISDDEKADFVQKLGAAEIINYRDENPQAYVARLQDGKGYAKAFDCVGGENIRAMLASLKPHGIGVTINARAELDISMMHGKALTLKALFILLPVIMQQDCEQIGMALARLAQSVKAGRLQIHKAHILPFSQSAQAFTLLGQGGITGKILIDVRAD